MDSVYKVATNKQLCNDCKYYVANKCRNSLHFPSPGDGICVTCNHYVNVAYQKHAIRKDDLKQGVYVDYNTPEEEERRLVSDKRRLLSKSRRYILRPISISSWFERIRLFWKSWF